MNKIAYRAAGVFCCLVAILLLWYAVYFPFFTVMAVPGKIICGIGGLIGAGFFGNIGTQFLITGGPTGKTRKRKKNK